MNDLPVGRSVDEVLRLVQAFQFTDKHGEGRELPAFLCVCIIYSNILSYCCMLSYNILVTLIVQCSVLVFAGWHASQKQKIQHWEERSTMFCCNMVAAPGGQA